MGGCTQAMGSIHLPVLFIFVDWKVLFRADVVVVVVVVVVVWTCFFYWFLL